MRPPTAKESARTLPRRWIDENWGTLCYGDETLRRIRPRSAPTTKRKNKASVYHPLTGRRITPGQQQKQQQEEEQQYQRGQQQKPRGHPFNRRKKRGPIEGNKSGALPDSWGRGGDASFASRGVGPKLELPRPSKGLTRARWPSSSVKTSVLRYIASARHDQGSKGNDGTGLVGALPVLPWPEHAEMKQGDVVVTVEHCYDCHRHRMTTRHDPEVYLRHANAVKELLTERLRESPIRLAVVIKKAFARRTPVPGGPGGSDAAEGVANTVRRRRVGAFEVQVAARHPSQTHLLHAQVVHSKLASGRWPRLGAGAYLPRRVQAALASWGFKSNRQHGSITAAVPNGKPGEIGELPPQAQFRPKPRARICWEFDHREWLQLGAASNDPAPESRTDINSSCNKDSIVNGGIRNSEFRPERLTALLPGETQARRNYDPRAVKLEVPGASTIAAACRPRHHDCTLPRCSLGDGGLSVVCVKASEATDNSSGNKGRERDAGARDGIGNFRGGSEAYGAGGDHVRGGDVADIRRGAEAGPSKGASAMATVTATFAADSADANGSPSPSILHKNEMGSDAIETARASNGKAYPQSVEQLGRPVDVYGASVATEYESLQWGNRLDAHEFEGPASIVGDHTGENKPSRRFPGRPNPSAFEGQDSKFESVDDGDGIDMDSCKAPARSNRRLTAKLARPTSARGAENRTENYARAVQAVLISRGCGEDDNEAVHGQQADRTAREQMAAVVHGASDSDSALRVDEFTTNHIGSTSRSPFIPREAMADEAAITSSVAENGEKFRTPNADGFDVDALLFCGNSCNLDTAAERHGTAAQTTAAGRDTHAGPVQYTAQRDTGVGGKCDGSGGGDGYAPASGGVTLQSEGVLEPQSFLTTNSGRKSGAASIDSGQEDGGTGTGGRSGARASNNRRAEIRGSAIRDEDDEYGPDFASQEDASSVEEVTDDAADCEKAPDDGSIQERSLVSEWPDAEYDEYGDDFDEDDNALSHFTDNFDLPYA